MLNLKSLPIVAAAGAFMLVLGQPIAADADVIMLGPGSPVTVTGISGVGTLTFSPTPATEIFEVTNPDFKTDFPNQDPTTVAAGIATVFHVSAPTLTANNESPSNPFTESVPFGFNYVAIHNDTGEILFFFSTLETSFTLNNSLGALSNARFYSVVPAPLIGHGLPVVLAVGGVLFGVKLMGRKRLRSLAAAATA